MLRERGEERVIGSHRKAHLAAIEAAKRGVAANDAVKENLSRLDKVAVVITDRIGTMGFFFIIVCWTVLWCGYNILASKVPALHLHAFDPFPAFVAYLLISNVIQIMLMPLLLVGQNLQGRHSEARAENDYLVNQKAFADTERILQRLEAQEEQMLRIEQMNKQILEQLAKRNLT
jgi:uncharacterized membrane protein